MVKCCDYTSGMLREPVTFEKQVTSDIGGGASQISYKARFSTRCKFESMSGSERLYAARIDATTKNRIVIRCRSDVIDSDRVLIRGRYYKIRFIDNIELRDKWLRIDLDGGVAT